MTAHPAHRLFFMHIMKTAGFTTGRQITNAFPNARIWGHTANDEIWFLRVYHYLNPRPLAHRPSGEIATYDIFYGHFPFTAHRLMGPDLTVATVIREPVDRVLSFLKHCQRNHPEHADRTLEEIYEDPWYAERFFHDHCVKLFAMTAEEMLLHTEIEGWDPRRMMLLNRWRDNEESVSQRELEGVFFDLRPAAPAREMYEILGAPNTALVELDDRRVRQAIDNLEGVDVLGLYERYPDFIDGLSARLGRRMRSDVTVNVGDETDVPLSLRRRIAADNRADVELYEAARRLTERRQKSSS